MPEQFQAKAITEEYRLKIYRLALSISRNEQDAQDILQNTLIKILRNISGFRSKSKLSTWIYRIAYNESLMFLRKKRRLFNSANAYRQYAQRLPPGVLVNWSRLPDEQLVDKELRQRIDESLRDLSIQYRMPLLLHRIEGFSLIDSARILGLEVSTVKTRLHRAYLMVKEQISDYFSDHKEHVHVSEAQCGRWTGFIFDYAQGKLGPKKKTAFKKHIRGCPRCVSFLDSYLQAIQITRFLDCRDIPRELKEKVKTFLPAK